MGAKEVTICVRDRHNNGALVGMFTPDQLRHEFPNYLSDRSIESLVAGQVVGIEGATGPTAGYYATIYGDDQRIRDAAPALLAAAERFLARVSNATPSATFSEEARAIVMESVDDFQDALAKARPAKGGG